MGDIPSMMTVEIAEEIRKAKDLTLEEFSIRLGYSSRAYAGAVRRGKISRWMAKEIRTRFRFKRGEEEDRSGSDQRVLQARRSG